MTKQDLIKRLAEVDRERNVIIQNLRKIGVPHKEKPVFNERQEFNKISNNLIGKYGILKNSHGVYVFKIIKIELQQLQILIFCEYMFISSNSSVLSTTYCSQKNSHLSLFRSKVFNKNTGSFDLSGLDNVYWIDECKYNKLTEKDFSLEAIKNELDICRDKLIEKQRQVTLLKIKEIEEELEEK